MMLEHASITHEHAIIMQDIRTAYIIITPERVSTKNA